MSRPPHPPRLDNSNYTRRRAQITQLLVIQFSTPSKNSSQIPSMCLRFEVFTAVTMKNAVFWDVTPCGSSNNRRLPKVLLVTAYVLSISLILSIMLMEAIPSPKRRFFEEPHGITSQKTAFFTLRLCSFLNVRDQVSHPCRNKGKIIVLYTLIFTCLDIRRENSKVCTEW
jgi:hypothetical protein